MSLSNYENRIISKKNLREMQNGEKKRQTVCDLQQCQTQTKASVNNIFKL